MVTESMDLVAAPAGIENVWSSRVVPEFGGHQVRPAEFGGDDLWHCRERTDKLSPVANRALEVRTRGGGRVRGWRPGELTVVPAGEKHQPVLGGPAGLLMTRHIETVAGHGTILVNRNCPSTTGAPASSAGDGRT